jgi:hypothetical protein
MKEEPGETHPLFIGMVKENGHLCHNDLNLEN